MDTTKSDNFDRLFWLLLLFMLSQNANQQPTFETAIDKFQNRLDTYLTNNSDILDKARLGSPLWQLRELKAVADGIGNTNQELRLRTLMVASTIIDFIEKAAMYSCVME